jgi:hypothetical protein
MTFGRGSSPSTWANTRNYEFAPVAGEELEKLAKDVTSQPPEIIERLKKVLGN